MNIRSAVNAALCLCVACAVLCAVPTAAQQDSNPAHQPPKYLFLSTVAIKPDMTGTYIDKESSQVQAMRNSNAPGSYIGMIAITGAPRALYFSGYDSFAEMEKRHQQAMAEDPKLRDTLRAADVDEAPMLGEARRSIYHYREDLSLNAGVDISQMRFFDIILFHVRPGHDQDWEHLVKLYVKAYSSIPHARWAMWEKMYGDDSDRTFILVSPMQALAEEDQAQLDGENLPKTVGQDQMEMMHQLGSVAVESSESMLFAVVPEISYAPQDWVKASPDFWGKK